MVYETMSSNTVFLLQFGGVSQDRTHADFGVPIAFHWIYAPCREYTQ